MSATISDTKITAFALGDLEGEERAEVERAVVLDPDLAARVEAVRLAAAAIGRGFQAEPLPEPPARPAGAPAPRAPSWGLLWFTGATAAACALLAIVLPTDMAPSGSRPERVRRASGPDDVNVLLYAGSVSSCAATDGDLFFCKVYATAPTPSSVDHRELSLKGGRDDVRAKMLAAAGIDHAIVGVRGHSRSDDPMNHDVISFSGTSFGIARVTDLNGDQIPDGRLSLAGLLESAPTYEGRETSSLLAAMHKAPTGETEAEGAAAAWQDKYGRLEGELLASPYSIAAIEGKINEKDPTIARLQLQLDALDAEESDVPLCERFWAGGSGTVRGFRFRTISPTEGGYVTGSNEDFVAYEDNDQILLLEENLYGLDVDGATAQFIGNEKTLDRLVRRLKEIPRGMIGAEPKDPPVPPQPDVEHNTEGYDHIVENPFLSALEEPLSTFSIDVDTASYANARRFLNDGQLPPPDAVRLEELINYFPYDYAPPTDDRPFAVHMEMASCPWTPEHKLLRIGLKGRTIEKRSPSNLVFLLDVSGSMDQPNKLPLVQRSMDLLVDQLTENDLVSIVVYAGASGLVLPPTKGNNKARLHEAIERLSAGGSTNGEAGIQLAYSIATQNLIQDGTNRVVLATDGDWNVGVTNQGDLTRLIEEKAKGGVFLSVLGFGMGNLKDDTLETLADKGNGNYAYVDTLAEARKVLVEQMTGTLCTIAKDVKVQIEFNPARIAGYRLLGYENRLLAKEDFNDDKKDAGEIGAGHTVTALYELVPADQEVPVDRPAVDPLKYQTPSQPTGLSLDLCTVKIRYKAPESSTSTLMEVPLKQGRERFDDASADFRFAAAVAGYGMLLRRSQYAKALTWDAVLEIASGALGEDREGYRRELLDLVKRAKELPGK